MPRPPTAALRLLALHALAVHAAYLSPRGPSTLGCAKKSSGHLRVPCVRLTEEEEDYDPFAALEARMASMDAAISEADASAEADASGTLSCP